MIKAILIGLAAIIALFLIIVTLRPVQFRVARSATLPASPEALFDNVNCRMDWKRPMTGTATVDFTFKPKGDRTVVTWAMYGRNNFMGKIVSLFMDCDKMVGPQFEKGLAELGAAAAAPAVATH